MPKPTFENLNAGKKKSITDAFLREFALHTFDEASITTVVKQLGIAKGSIYQYFEDKLDLFNYLIQASSVIKMKYIATLKRSDFPDFWAYFKALYICGYQFDEENPLESHFLHNLASNINSPSIKHLFSDLLTQTVIAFNNMVKTEVELGLFRDDISIDTMGYQLYKTGTTIHEHLKFAGIIDPDQSILNNTPVYQGKKKKLMSTVEEHIKLIKPAFDKPQSK